LVVNSTVLTDLIGFSPFPVTGFQHHRELQIKAGCPMQNLSGLALRIGEAVGKGDASEVHITTD
jgi:hypothetical protein